MPVPSLQSYGGYTSSYDSPEYLAGQAGGSSSTLNNKYGTGGPADPNDPATAYINKLQGMMTGQFSPNDPSYQWRFQQGQQAVERSNAAKGLLNSGNAAIELQQYGQGMASQEYTAQWNRILQGMSGVESTYNTQQQRLMQLAGINLEQQGMNLNKDKLGLAQGEFGLAAEHQQFTQDWMTAQDQGIGAGMRTNSDALWSSGNPANSNTSTSTVTPTFSNGYVGTQYDEGGGVDWSSDVSSWGMGG